MAITLKKIYSDLDLSFNRNPNTGDVAISYDEQAVIRSLKNLLQTNHYDRPFQPDLGTNLTGLLFENTSKSLETTIAREIRDCVRNFEPRVTFIDDTENQRSIVVNVNSDGNGYNVTLTFYVGNNTSATTLNLLLKRTR
jgi:phage baseplate assembly protein W